MDDLLTPSVVKTQVACCVARSSLSCCLLILRLRRFEMSKTTTVLEHFPLQNFSN